MQVNILSSSVKHIQGDPVEPRKNLFVSGAKGERVAFQVILSGEFHHVSIFVESECRTEVFWEKYIHVEKTSSGLTKKGMYPDIMLDLKKAEAFGEIDSDFGEGVFWCFADIPFETDRECFEILFHVMSGEEKETVSAKIEVFDFSLPQENHSRTLFVMRGDMLRAESLAEREEKYCALAEELFHYRLSPARPLPEDVTDLKKLTERIKQLAEDDRCTVYSVPYFYRREDTIFEKNQPCLDLDRLRELLLLLIEESTDEKDLLKKACFYIGFIDEPEPQHFHRVIRVCREIYDLKRELVKSIDFSGKRGVESSLLVMDNIVTSFIKEPLYGAVDTWCPTYWAYYKPEYIYEESKIRGLGRKCWWYGCLSPWTPFPNLHTDSPMKDSRLEGWLRYKFDIGGNLYWSVNLTKKFDGEKRTYIDCDILEESMLFPGACGDGLLFYTETKYGIPLPSLRVFSMFLGLQEYEYFWLLDTAAKQYTFFYGVKPDIRRSLEGIFERIAQGTLLIYDFDAETMRRELGQLVLFAQNGLFVFGSYQQGEYILEIFSPREAVIRCDGALLSKKSFGDGKRWLFSYRADSEVRAKISADINAKTLSLQYYLGRKRVSLSGGKGSDGAVLSGRGKKRYLYIPPFVNEEKPKISFPLALGGSQIDRIYATVRSFSSEAFIVSVVLVDEKGGRYHPGYDLIRENSMTEISVAVTELMQNGLNDYPMQDADKNRENAESFCFDRLRVLELIFSENVKLLDDNRERKGAEFAAVLEDVSVSLFN